MTETRAAGVASRLTAVQWVICGVAALGFAFDLYEILVMPIVLRPALVALGGLEPGTREFNRWVGLLFYVPALIGGGSGSLAAIWPTSLAGDGCWSGAFSCTPCHRSRPVARRRCRSSSRFAARPSSVSQWSTSRRTWLAELFADPKRRQAVLGYTQSAGALGGLMVTGAYYLAVTYAERLPEIGTGHEPWRYVLLFGLAPAIPLIIVRPFLPESPVWQAQRSGGCRRRPSIAQLFRPEILRTTVVTTILFACTYGLASGVLLQTPRIVPGLPGVHHLAPREIEQAVSSVQFIGELGVLAGRLLLAFLSFGS